MKSSLSDINIFMDDPGYSEMRLVIISEYDGSKRGYISGDGEKLFEYKDFTVEGVLLKISNKCQEIING